MTLVAILPKQKEAKYFILEQWWIYLSFMNILGYLHKFIDAYNRYDWCLALINFQEGMLEKINK